MPADTPAALEHGGEKDAGLTICSRGHDETHRHVTPSGKRVCIPCRQLRKKRKEDRRRQSWPFVEMLPAETGYNLGHHRTRPGDEHVTGEGCHCLPDRIPHTGTNPTPPEGTR